MRHLGSMRMALGRVRRRRTVAPWPAYLAGVEPALAADARVHRFAVPAILGSGDAAAAPLAVWIEDGGQELDRTLAALGAGTFAPAAVLGGSLAEALSATRVDHLLLLRAGDTPAPLALQRLGQAVRLAPDATVITCDEDELARDGSRVKPRFRPGPSPDRWLACDDSGAMLVVSRAGLEAPARLDTGPGWRHTLAMALAGPDGARHAHVPMLLCHRGVLGPPACAQADAVQELLRRWEPGARIEAANGIRRVRREASEVSVEVIVCFRDKAMLTERCVRSVLERTAYERLSVALVDNGSVEAATASLRASLSEDPRVRVVDDPRPFNFARLNNGAARTSEADVLVFLNNDTEVLTEDWLEPLLEEALRPQVGAVAPMLLFEDGAVQHAGAALGIHGYAGHPFAGLTPDAPTPFGRAAGGTRNWMAVSAACMMVQRAKFLPVGGFDESFVVAGNDVDLCLRLTAAGHRSLCVPHVRLLHDESRSRGVHIDPGDFAASARSYGAFRTVGDPFYNPNLTLRATDCGVRTPGEQVG